MKNRSKDRLLEHSRPVCGARLRLVRKTSLLLGLVACASPRKPVVVTPAVLNVKLTSTADPTLGADSVMSMGCIPDRGDSTQFTIAVILETPSPVDGSFNVAFHERRASPDYSYPNVSASLYPYGTRRVSGTACAKSGGVVFRASLKRIWQATIAADPPGALMVEVYTSAGHPLVAKRLTRSTIPQTITWTTPPDTVTADSLIRELPALLTFQVVAGKQDTTVNGLFLARPPAAARLARVQATMPFALTWMLEGARGYDRARLLKRFGSDTAAMGRAFVDAIQHDRAFTASMLRLAAPLLAAEGTTVTGAPARRPVALTRSQAVALAARYFQVFQSNGKVGMSICAKPGLLHDRPMKRDDVVEAWFYSVVRPRGGSTDVSDVAFGLLKEVQASLPAAAAPRRLETELWRRLEADPRLWQRIQSEYHRTAAWAPVRIIE